MMVRMSAMKRRRAVAQGSGPMQLLQIKGVGAGGIIRIIGGIVCGDRTRVLPLQLRRTVEGSRLAAGRRNGCGDESR